MKHLLLILSLAAVMQVAQAATSEERQAMYDKIFAMTPEERADYFGTGGHGRPADSRGDRGNRPEGAGGNRPANSYGQRGGRPEGVSGRPR